MNNQNTDSNKYVWIVPLFLLIIIFFTIGFLFNKRIRVSTNQQLPEKRNLAQSVQGKYLFNGTIFWGRAIEKWSLQPNGEYDYAHPFSGLKTFDRKKYDAWVADLECPVLDKVIPYDVQVNQLVFNCRPEYLKEAAKYFNIIDLANNHSGDQGQDGFEATRNAVTTSGVQVYGNYDSANADDTCEIIALPIRVITSDKKTKKSQMPVAFCAWHYFNKTPGAGEIERMKQYAKIMPVFAFVHMGTEYNTTAQPGQIDIAHRVIDAGADFVIANNPHWIQNSEVYKNKLIFYSTGNFIFDQIDAEGMQSASVSLDMSIKYDQNIQKWLDLASNCTDIHDNCLQLANGLKKPKYSLKFGVVAGDNSGRLTKKGSPSLQTSIEERTNWAKTVQRLHQR